MIKQVFVLDLFEVFVLNLNFLVNFNKDLFEVLMKASTQKNRLIHKIGLHEGLRETPRGHSMRKSLRRRLALSEVFVEDLISELRPSQRLFLKISMLIHKIGLRAKLRS